MFLKQYNYKPRSGSQSSSDSMSSNTSNSNSNSKSNSNSNDSPSTSGKGASASANALPGAVQGGSSATPTPAKPGERRRSSTSSPFAGLTSLKRNAGDAEADARKASFMEQKPGSSNPISNMWNNFTKGPTGAG